YGRLRAGAALVRFRSALHKTPRHLRRRGLGLFLAAAGVQPGPTARCTSRFLRFLRLRGAGAGAAQPLALLDELADLLATLVADLRVELGTAAGAHALSALLSDLLVELVPALRLDRLAAFLADLLVEGASALLRDLHTPLAPRFGNRHPALLLVRHSCLRWLEGSPLPSAVSPLASFQILFLPCSISSLTFWPPLRPISS